MYRLDKGGERVVQPQPHVLRLLALGRHRHRRRRCATGGGGGSRGGGGGSRRRVIVESHGCRPRLRRALRLQKLVELGGSVEDLAVALGEAALDAQGEVARQAGEVAQADGQA